MGVFGSTWERDRQVPTLRCLLPFTPLSLGLVDLSLSLGEASLELLDRLATLLVEQVFVGERDSDSGEETDASRYEDPDEGVQVICGRYVFSP